MLRAQSPNDLLFNLTSLRRKDAVKSFRRAIIDEYPTRGCAYCGRSMRNWTLDHIIPKSKGGPTRRWNLAKCCSRCNGNKGSIDVLPWYRPQLFWDEYREETLFEWMRSNATMDSAMNALEQSLREGTLDKEALEDLKQRPEKRSFWDTYCDANPWEKECLIYEC